MSPARKTRLLRRLARLDQALAASESALSGATRPPTRFVRGVTVVKQLRQARADVEAKLRNLVDDRGASER
jgi:penicillin V acylase-like amidase (Ntn superfamily)